MDAPAERSDEDGEAVFGEHPGDDNEEEQLDADSLDQEEENHVIEDNEEVIDVLF